jgi:hypothetical protein
MAIQSDPLSRNIDLIRNLSDSILSGSEVFAAWQFDSMQALVTRSSQQLRTAWADAGAAQEPAKWSETLQNGMRNAIKLNRDYLIASTDYQMETMRLLQDMSSEMQQLITEAMNEQLVNIDVIGARVKRNGKATTLSSQKLAA